MLEALAFPTVSMFHNYSMTTMEVKFSVGFCCELRKVQLLARINRTYAS